MSIHANFLVQQNDFVLNVEVDFPAQGTTVIFGPSGSGKTTLLRAIAGLERSPHGFLKIGDQVWQDETVFVPVHQRSIGYVFQQSSLFHHLTVKRNIDYGLKRIASQQQKIQLQETIELLGIGHLLARYPSQLSGGEQQRVAIARALAVSPDLLLLDEPLASLDEQKKIEIMPYLESLNREFNLPMLYVTHSRDELARLGEHIVLLDNGQVVASGLVNEMFARLDSSLAQSHDAETVVQARVIKHDDNFGLSYLETDIGTVLVTRSQLAVGYSTKLRIFARDVSLTLQQQTDTSILNILPATIDEMVEINESQVLIKLLINTHPLLAKITKKSAVDLRIKIGSQVCAQVKTMALLS